MNEEAQVAPEAVVVPEVAVEAAPEVNENSAPVEVPKESEAELEAKEHGNVAPASEAAPAE